MRRLRDAEVTPAMSAWAQWVGQDTHWVIGEQRGPEDFQGLSVVGVVEEHQNGTTTNPAPHPHPGVSLYEDVDNEIVPTHATLAEGVDVSGYQTRVDWSQIAASGRTFTYIKATEGVSVVDPMLANHVAAAHDNGFRCGAYHFLRARDGAEQVQHFLDTIARYPWELPPCLDVEVVDGQSLSHVADVVEACCEATPLDFVIYTMPGFWGTMRDINHNGAELWVAHWGVAKPTIPKGWDKAWCWQYASNAIVPGYPGHADTNRMMP